MDELVKQIAGKAKISEKQAQTALDTVLSFVKKQLPAPIADQVEKVLKGEGSAGFGDLAGGLGDLLKKK